MELRFLKSISWLLRHGAIKENIAINNEGYILISDLLLWLEEKKKCKITYEDLVDIVANDNKGRLTISREYIRANQGHSMDIQINFESYKCESSQIMHATYNRNKESIKQNGLKVMSRNYVHLINIDSSCNKFHMIRQDTDLYVFVNGNEINLKSSDNGVILAKDIPSKNLTFVNAYEKMQSGCYGFIIYDTTGSNVLIVETKSGILGFPKGKKEKGEIPIECAFRELKEETNLDPEDLIILNGCLSEVNQKNNVPTNYYRAKVKENIGKELYCLDENENLNIKWMSISEIMQIDDNKFYPRRKKLII